MSTNAREGLRRCAPTIGSSANARIGSPPAFATDFASCTTSCGTRCHSAANASPTFGALDVADALNANATSSSGETVYTSPRCATATRSRPAASSISAASFA